MTLGGTSYVYSCDGYSSLGATSRAAAQSEAPSPPAGTTANSEWNWIPVLTISFSQLQATAIRIQAPSKCRDR